jgi:hypothetical protein
MANAANMGVIRDDVWVYFKSLRHHQYKQHLQSISIDEAKSSKHY